MDLDLTLSLDPMSYMPEGPIGWALQILPPAFGIWSERTAQRLARVSYLFSLILRVIGLVILNWLALSVLSGVYGMPSVGEIFNPTQYEGYWPLTITGYALAALFPVILMRPLVWRMRDAGIEKKWAYLAVLPYLNFLMFFGLLFYPPSKAAAEPASPVMAQT
jgi:uncharacterized membrane protein YhaH (DUF805 family)